MHDEVWMCFCFVVDCILNKGTATFIFVDYGQEKWCWMIYTIGTLNSASIISARLKVLEGGEVGNVSMLNFKDF